ncbi:POT family proton-dependent oligopeptide transporter [Mucilaginibacter yixingensis]|uniref:POT family proton-dependent oligopeptide transporter n=1 Tax=Mucilaginibacter yixingensis TaxID=1295612 RepID=A0A2T5J5U1_9SPHI|nr:POT family MFS transporter [Mucilaginibacter yixingensis]PTQ93641.1 POT family proton-dependent oligopeptide transporter [Mucilaginibacter yixingensis]
MSAETAVSVQKTKSKYPRSIPFIIGNEAAERFSFYGMRSILVIFLVNQFYNPTHNPALTTVAQAKANADTHFFVALAYSLPFVGGLVADWFTGKYRIILNISIVYCIGHLFLALFDNNLDMFTAGLVLIAIGAGGIKSCVSANVGDQFDASNQDLLSKVYGWFYFSINAGSVISTILIPWVYEAYGAKWAFGIPGVLMALATIIFFSGRKLYVRVPPAGVNKDNFVFISLYALFHAGQKQKGQSLLDVAKAKHDPEKVEGVKAVYRVIMVFFFALAFWAVWDQNLSEWVLQADTMNREINLGFTKFTMLAGQVQTFNPVFLLIFIPIFNYWIYPALDKMGLKTTPLRRLGFGLFLTALSFAIIAWIQSLIDHGAHPSIWWQILAYVVLSAAEVLVSITGLEYAYTHSPKSMKSTMTAIWLLVVALGNLITGAVNKNISNHGFLEKYMIGANYYWFFVGFVSIFTVAFMIISPRLKEHNYITAAEEGKIVADTNNL